jgi:two-component system response regulator DesR
MRIANPRHGTAPAPRPVATTVAGGDPPTRLQVLGLLEAAGFSVGDYAAPAIVLTLLIDVTDAERVGDVRRLIERHPEACLLAVMPAAAQNASLKRVLLAGATGIVLDDELDRALVPTARATLAGQLAVPTALGRQIAPRPLSHREKQILAQVMLGRTNREIAHRLFLAESTVKTHLSSAFRKLEARSRSEAVSRITDPDSGYASGIMELVNDSFAAAS